MRASIRRFFYVAAVLLMVAACDPRAKQHEFTARIIKDAHAEQTFADASTDQSPAILHRESGMLCEMPADGVVHVEVFPSDAANAGAECTYSTDNVVVTMIAVKFRDRPQLDAAFAESVSANARLDRAAQWRGHASDADAHPAAGSPHFRVLRLQGSFQSNDAFMRLAMAEANGWYVQQIVLTPSGNADTVEASAGAAWRDVLRSVGRAAAAAKPAAHP
ncbi:MAG: hypothetical protein QM759_05200 [Terricaulis sp.]